MTTTPPSEEPRNDRPSGEIHTCYNCFADFTWEPTIHDGEEFCCSGCVEGGPCICTYDGPPKPAEDDMVPTAVVSEDEAEFFETDFERITHREILLEAIEELPAQLRQIARFRVTSASPLGEIARDIDLTADQATLLLEQAQAILNRTLGPEYTIEYVTEGIRPQHIIIPSTVESPVAEFIQPTAQISEPTPEPVAESDLSAAIRAPLEALTAPLLGAQATDGETAVAQSTIREALRDASAIFRLAAERLGEDADEHPLRRLLAD